MKTILYVVLVASLALFQNWAKVERAIKGPPHLVQSQVVLYATSSCPYCKMTRALLARHQVRYVEMDIERSMVARRQYDQLGGGGVPILVVNDTVVRGYDPDKMLSVLYE
jgi:mycoredoxin